MADIKTRDGTEEMIRRIYDCEDAVRSVAAAARLVAEQLASLEQDLIDALIIRDDMHQRISPSP